MKNKITNIILIAIVFTGCTDSPKVVFPNKEYKDFVWNEVNKQKNIAIHNLDSNNYSSTHLIHLKGSEQPHFHDKHNLTVTIISGESIIHFKDHEVILQKGDIVHIPKGTYHWAENIDSEASVVFANFAPAYRGKDMRLAK